MSGREPDSDGTDSCHAEHPWEQVGHPLYLPETSRAKSNWPPEPAFPDGPMEAMKWASLPEQPPKLHGNWYRQYGKAGSA
jgi:hypothetical protein